MRSVVGFLAAGWVVDPGLLGYLGRLGFREAFGVTVVGLGESGGSLVADLVGVPKCTEALCDSVA
jgi:hypothetical protein